MPAIIDYQCVLAVRQERNFARAAATLGISQPALTARIRRLEEDLDIRLFDRGRHGARVTAAGSAFAETAERIVSMAQEAVNAAKGAQRGVGQNIRVGFTQIAAQSCLLPALKAFRAEHPLVRVQLREATTARLETLVAEDRLDAALLHPPVHTDDLAELHLHSCKIIQVAHADGSDAGRPPVEYPRSDAPVLISEYNRKYPGAQDTPPTAEADTTFGALLLAQAGFGPCLIAQDIWTQSPPLPFMTAHPIDMEIATTLVWRRTDRRETVRQLVATCKSVFPQSD